MAPRRSRLPAFVGAAAAAAAVGYLVYTLATKEDTSSTTTTSTQTSAKPAKSAHSKITVVVSPELAQSGVDFRRLMEQHPNLVLIVPPMVANKVQRALKTAVGHEHAVKVIRCDTDVGVIHVIKHIRPELALIAAGTGDNIQGEIKRFVGSSEALDADVALAAERLSGL
ncbi:hypothetical protein CJU89_2788 [Yarrowia sp. B02]|nr:hypothetical protein CJU89_2788 [Yarrowia sp. B02]